MRLFCFVLAGLAIFTNVRAEPPITVIANPAAPVDHIDKGQATQIFLKQVRNWPDGTPITPIDLKPGSPIRDAFYRQVTGREPAQLRAYWARQAFTGMGFPPVQVTSTEQARHQVRETPGAISYVDRAVRSAAIKVVLESNP